MGGLLTCRQCSTRMESLKDHSLWDISRTQMKNCFWFTLATAIVLTLWIIYYTRAPPELGRKCPNDQARFLHNISQLEAEKVTLKTQLTKKEKEMQELRKVMNQAQGKSLQLLEKKQEVVNAVSKESSDFNQSLVLTRQFLEKEREKTQSLQSQLEIAQEDRQKTQQQRDSCQKQLNTLEEKLKDPDTKAEEYNTKIAELQRQIGDLNSLSARERAEKNDVIMELKNQIRFLRQKKCSIEDILDGVPSIAWVLGILVLFICCVTCCRQDQ